MVFLKGKRGFSLIFAFMIGILLFFLGIALAPALKDTVHSAVVDPIIDCHNTSISNQAKAVCTQLDLYLPLWVGLMFGLGGAVLTGLAT